MAKGKKGEAGEGQANAVPEVDKTFYELTITDLNRKIARLRTSSAEIEVKNEELESKLKTLEEDRNDVISYLKRMVQEKIQTIKELHEKIEGLEEVRCGEIEVFKKDIRKLNDEFKQMNEQLTSEIKLLTGKLNSLDEFRVQKEDLMKKFETQENKLVNQEVSHKQEIYETERKFVVGKDKLKKDMEQRLVQLSTDFQNITELRIASTTQRVIRENIAVNNELDAVFETHKRLQKENADLKNIHVKLKLNAELHKVEKNMVLGKNSAQSKLIQKLVEEHEDLESKLKKQNSMEETVLMYKKEMQKLVSEVESLQFRTRVLEQNLHASRCERNSLKIDLDYTSNELDRVSTILRDSVEAIKESLNLNKKKKLKAPQNDKLLSNLLLLLNKGKEEKIRRPSLDSLESISATYIKGDLGLVPKNVTLPSKIPTKVNKEAQPGPSFDELVASFVPRPTEPAVEDDV